MLKLPENDSPYSIKKEHALRACSEPFNIQVYNYILLSPKYFFGMVNLTVFRGSTT